MEEIRLCFQNMMITGPAVCLTPDAYEHINLYNGQPSGIEQVNLHIADMNLFLSFNPNSSVATITDQIKREILMPFNIKLAMMDLKSLTFKNGVIDAVYV